MANFYETISMCQEASYPLTFKTCLKCKLGSVISSILEMMMNLKYRGGKYLDSSHKLIYCRIGSEPRAPVFYPDDNNAYEKKEGAGYSGP